MNKVFLNENASLTHWNVKDWSDYVLEVYFKDYIERNISFRSLHIEIDY